MQDGLSDLIRVALEKRGQALYRSRYPRGASDPSDFSSNDYLGLRRHPRVIDAMIEAARKWGVGSGASPLITGYTEAHRSAEQAIARWKGTEAAVLLPSGYQANHAAIQALVGSAESAERPIRFLFDKLVHASLVDAIVGSGKPFRTFGHDDLSKLQRLLDDAEGAQQIVVTESIFSMDGDAADLHGIVELKERYHFALVVDEAHGSGVYGDGGSGYASEVGVAADVDVSIVTLSKAVGCAGGAVCGSRHIAEAVTNFGRAYIYSTAIPPALAAASEAAIEVMAREPHRQHRVRALAKQVRSSLTAAGWSLAAGDSPIIPVVVGDEQRALNLAEKLREKGLIAKAVRPPTVPKGSSRLRITLSAEHSDQDVERLIEALGCYA